MSKSTYWLVTDELPEVICCVDNAHDSVRARYINEQERPNREAELNARWEAAMRELGIAKELISDMWANGAFGPGAYCVDRIDEFEKRSLDLGIEVR